MFQVLVSRTFQREFHKVPAEYHPRIKTALTCLEKDPFTSRSHADITLLKDTHPQKYRVRVGDYRIVYVVEGHYFKVIDIFHRRHGSSSQ